METLASLTIDSKTHPDIFHQLVHVLRIQSRDLVSFFPSGSPHDYVFSLTLQDKKQLIFEHVSVVDTAKELPFQLILVQAIPQKTEKWEWIVQKGTELGVHTFIPLITERTQRQNLPKMERMNKIIIEAVEQCGRSTIPQVTTTQNLNSWIPSHLSIFASLATNQPLLQVLKPHPIQNTISCIIGPEGGFTPNEEQRLQHLGSLPYSLGSTVLRLETAALVSLGIMSQLR